MIWTRGTLFSAATILLFLSLAAVSLVWLSVTQRDLQREVGESNLWAAGQAEREGLRFLIVVEESSAEGMARNEVALQFELLYSRIALLAVDPQRAFLRSIGQETAIARASTLVDSIDAILNPALPGETAMVPNAGISLPAQAAELVALTHDIALATYLAERRAGFDLRERQLRAIALLRVSVIGGAVAGLTMAALLVRDKRRLMQVTVDLRAHETDLQLTIADRTVALREALATETRAKEVYRSFVVTVAHQLRTSVSIIHLTAQRQVRSTAADLPEGARRRFARILDAAERLERLIAGFLETAAVEQRALAADRSLIDFNAIASVAAVQIRSAHPDRRLTCNLGTDPLPVEGDAVLLEQVVLNILSNAMKYSGDDDEVTMSTDKHGNRIRCAIRDRGCGIPQDALGSIFERYYRAPMAHRLPGVGVGLSLAAEIVALHDGCIEVLSTVGEGSTFTILLPIGKAKRQGGSPSETDNLVH